jgi:small multidrug resistance pump
MKTLPVGTTYASFAGLCIIATSFVGFVKFNQLPNIYSIFGLLLIITGVGLVNILGQN